MFFDRQGNPVADAVEWAKMKMDKHVAETTLPDGKWVSTVWLGIDHNFGGGIPLIFETMVFPKKGEYGELECRRYSTEQEAIAGHEEVVDRWTKGGTNDQ